MHLNCGELYIAAKLYAPYHIAMHSAPYMIVHNLYKYTKN